MFILEAIIGYAILGVVALLDKLILAKKVAHPLTYVFYIAAPFLLLAPLLFFGVNFPTCDCGWSVIFSAGLFFFFGLWLMLVGVQKSEISHIGPLVGASVSLSTVLLSRIFLGEFLPINQLCGIGLLIIGSLVISSEKSKRHSGFHLGMLWGLLSGLAFAMSYIASKYAYDSLGFYSGFVLTRGVIGLCGLFLLFLPFVRREVFAKNEASRSSKHNRTIVFINLVLSAAGVLLIQHAIASGSVSIVSAFEGLKYALLIILVALLSRFFPKILKEDYAKGEMGREVVAILLICVGLVLLV